MWIGNVNADEKSTAPQFVLVYRMCSGALIAGHQPLAVRKLPVLAVSITPPGSGPEPSPTPAVSLTARTHTT